MYDSGAAGLIDIEGCIEPPLKLKTVKLGSSRIPFNYYMSANY